MPTDTDPLLGVGVTLGYSAYPNPTSYTNFSKILDTTPPAKTRAKVETTNHDNTDRRERQIAAFSSTSDLILDLLYQKSWQNFLDGAYEAATIYSWKLTYADGSFRTFAAFICELSETAPLKDKMTSRVGLCIIDSAAPHSAS